MTSYEKAEAIIRSTPRWILEIVEAELERQRQSKRPKLRLIAQESDK